MPLRPLERQIRHPLLEGIFRTAAAMLPVVGHRFVVVALDAAYAVLEEEVDDLVDEGGIASRSPRW